MHIQQPPNKMNGITSDFKSTCVPHSFDFNRILSRNRLKITMNIDGPNDRVVELEHKVNVLVKRLEDLKALSTVSHLKPSASDTRSDDKADYFEGRQAINNLVERITSNLDNILRNSVGV